MGVLARPADGVAFAGADDFGNDIEPGLRAIPFFRAPTDDEVDRSWSAYNDGDFGALCDVWCRVAEPTRASLGPFQPYYDKAHLMPARANALVFLATVRAVLRAGERFRATLSPPVKRALETEFPWLERRHEHIPAGWTPPFVLPDELRRFIDVRGGGDALALDEARVRWQLVAALNEVQQQHYSRHAATRFGVPELTRHAARERALALSYLGHWAPPASRELWRQCLYVLDGLNAATFDLLCNREVGAFIRFGTRGLVTGGGEWRAFVAALERPQWLLP